MQTKMDMAREGLERVLCEQMAGDGTALLAAITGSSSSTTITVGTGANFYWLYPERIVDIDVADEMRGAFLEYAVSVIHARALALHAIM